MTWAPVFDATSYQLQNQVNGTWSTVYTGSQTSFTMPLSGDGLYRFKVRACNSSGCSGFLVYQEMRLSSGPSRAGSPNPPARAPAAAPTGMSSVDIPPTLGMGYDRLRQELTNNTCLAMAGATVTRLPARTKTFDLSQVKTREELSTALKLTSDLSISAKYGNYGASYSGKKELVSNATRVEETTMLVASLRDQFRVDSLANAGSLSLASNNVALLLSGQAGQYRNICGDGYVYAIAYGREAYFTIQLLSSTHSTDEIRSKTDQLKIDIGNWVSAGYNSTTKTQITQRYNQYDVKVRVMSAGSSVVVSGVYDLATGLQYLQAFENEPVVNGDYPIDHDVSDYQVPSSVPASLYPDYRPYLLTLHRWYSFDQQLATRCQYFDDNLAGPTQAEDMSAAAQGVANGLSPRDACFQMKRAVQENIQDCEDTTKWATCIQPDSPSCAVPGTSNYCLQYANRVPAWRPTSTSLTLQRDLGAGLSSASATVSAGPACLPPMSIVDLRISAADCAGQNGCPSNLEGVTVTTYDMVGASAAGNWLSNGNQCLNATVNLHRGSWWTGGARINQTQTLNGLSAEYPSYLF